MPIYPNNIPTILIVDDEPFNLEFLEIVLLQQGYNILTATNGRSGRKLAEQKKPDLILLDIMMPDETGFECATVLRLSPETSEIPIIFLSALDDDSNTSRGYDAGAVDFIVKPFIYKDVINRIRLHLKLNNCDKQLKLPAKKAEASRINETPFPATGARAVFYSSAAPCASAMHEAIVMDDSNENHLLLNTPPGSTEKIRNKVRTILAANSGPLFNPSETLRNVGLQLEDCNGENDFSASYVHFNRDAEKLTAVNAGALPMILMRADKSHTLIERQSGNLGSLGLGLLPCSTYKIHKGDRIFISSRGLLGAFEREGEGIRELLETCRRFSEEKMESACRAIGKAFLKGSEADGILVGIER
ncbi:response regulator [Maridesulfovibrio sp.]|uniref:response regulator n=1 Tax=Maridesulfovibrio sp. TaxID=2795000 RepID=UPI0029CA577E|nr:response regulator [Maridesulfovibrio sp.]